MKYPRTLHLDFSPGAGSDDKILDSLDTFINVPLVITEKLDGSNACLKSEAVFARTHSTPAKHVSFSLLKQKHQKIAYQLHPQEEIFGENCYAVHSIIYQELPSHFFVFAIREGEIWKSWEEVKQRALELGLTIAPELGRYTFSSKKELQKTVEALCKEPSIYGGPREGVVLRALESFSDKDFSQKVCKWVRAGHVQTDDHWMHQAVTPQNIKNKN